MILFSVMDNDAACTADTQATTQIPLFQVSVEGNNWQNSVLMLQRFKKRLLYLREI